MAQLIRAAGRGDLDAVSEMRDQWSFQNKKGETALHVAVAEDQVEVVNYMVPRGAPLNLQEKKQKFTPLMLCLAQQPPNYLELMQTILKGSPDLSLQDASGQTVLHLAAQYGLVEALELLVRAKPQIDALDGKRMTALHIACGKGDDEAIRLLVERGHANVNAVDGQGNTPLHWVCINNSSDLPELIEYLVSKGAKALKNKKGNTPLHSEAMHCIPNSEWPTSAASALLQEFPQLEQELNDQGLNAKQLFEKGFDEEEEVQPQAQKQQKAQKRSGRGGQQATDFDGAAAARAAAIMHTRKKMSKGSSSSGGSPWLIWLLLIAMVVASLAYVVSLSS